MKRCPRCGETKAADAFARRAAYCRPCMTDYRREWRNAPENADKVRAQKRRHRAAHGDRLRAERRSRYQREDKDRLREQARAWRAANPDRVAAYAVRESQRWARLLRTQGITREQYEALYAHQGGRCAICRCDLPAGIVRKGDPGVRPHLDHDHATGDVRGILCGPCNQALGLLADDPMRLRRAIRYLSGRGWPASSGGPRSG